MKFRSMINKIKLKESVVLTLDISKTEKKTFKSIYF